LDNYYMSNISVGIALVTLVVVSILIVLFVSGILVILVLAATTNLTTVVVLLCVIVSDTGGTFAVGLTAALAVATGIEFSVGTDGQCSTAGADVMRGRGQCPIGAGIIVVFIAFYLFFIVTTAEDGCDARAGFLLVDADVCGR
jgi:hypothetical protein